MTKTIQKTHLRRRIIVVKITHLRRFFPFPPIIRGVVVIRGVVLRIPQSGVGLVRPLSRPKMVMKNAPYVSVKKRTTG